MPSDVTVHGSSESSTSSENTRKAYARATRQFFQWCEGWKLQLGDVGLNAAALYVRSHGGADATVKQHLAALRKLYDWLVTEQVVEENPFSSVRGPKLVRNEGETPSLSSEEVQELFARIDAGDTVIALRDGALTGTMLCTFGRVGAMECKSRTTFRPTTSSESEWAGTLRELASETRRRRPSSSRQIGRRN